MFKFKTKQEKADESLLAYAARGDVLYPAFRELFEKKTKPDVTVTDKHGRTALHLAAEAGGLKGAILLLSHGAPLDTTDKTGNTPLMLALENGYDEIAAYLVKLGAKTDVKNLKGETPASIAAQSASADVKALAPYLRGEKTLEEMFRQRAQEEADKKVIAAAKEFTGVDELRKALDAGGSPNAVDAGGYSALLWAATRHDPGEVELLVKRGADIDFQNEKSKNYTPLMAAASRGNTPIVETLLKLGADATLKNAEGKDACEIALQQGQPTAASLIAQKLPAQPVAKAAKGSAKPPTP